MRTYVLDLTANAALRLAAFVIVAIVVAGLIVLGEHRDDTSEPA